MVPNGRLTLFATSCGFRLRTRYLGGIGFQCDLMQARCKPVVVPEYLS